MSKLTGFASYFYVLLLISLSKINKLKNIIISSVLSILLPSSGFVKLRFLAVKIYSTYFC